MNFDRVNPINRQIASSARAMTVREAQATADRAAGHFPI
jgi:hypothetical protein